MTRPIVRGRATAPPFQQLEHHARRVRRFFVVMVATIALLPAVIFVFLEVGHHRLHAGQAARRVATSLAAHVERSGPDLARITDELSAELHAQDVAAIRLIGLDGVQVVRVGEPSWWSFFVAVDYPLGAGPAPFSALRVDGDDRMLSRRIGRVVAIHLVVASVLALIVFHVPMRALRLAIAEGERTYAQLLHADKLSAIGEMYAGLSHEIDNPLGVVLANARFLLTTAEERGLPPDVVEELGVIDRNGTRVAEIIRGLLAFARKAKFDLTETDLNRVIRDVVSLLQRPFAKQHVEIETRLDPSTSTLRGSPDHLQQVFVNLLNNARDAMPGGGTITLRTRMNGTDVLAEVEDTGTGITPEVRSRIFEPFFTTKPVGKGTGMGLAVSYGIVRAHGGNVEVETERDRGALFRLRLPVRGPQ